MIQLQDVERGTMLGTITPAPRRFLVDELEEESSADRDCHVSADTGAAGTCWSPTCWRHGGRWWR